MTSSDNSEEVEFDNFLANVNNAHQANGKKGWKITWKNEKYKVIKPNLYNCPWVITVIGKSNVHLGRSTKFVAYCMPQLLSVRPQNGKGFVIGMSRIG